MASAVHKLRPEDQARIGKALVGKDLKGFAWTQTNGHVIYTWEDGKWDEGRFEHDPYIRCHIMSNCFHYGQACFEGQKAFHLKDGRVCIFNDKANALRMQMSNTRMMMPLVPVEMFQKALDWVVHENLEYLPTYDMKGCSLYIRPFCIGVGDLITPVPSNKFHFVVMVMPVGSYYAVGKNLNAVDGVVIEEFDRAAPRGVGNVKVAGNYGADIYPAYKYKKLKGFPLPLYLDPKEKRYIEEFNTSNFAAITKDGTYITSESAAILDSITNRCLQVLAHEMNVPVERRPIDFDAEVSTFDEVGAIGTAVVITPCKSLTRGETKYHFSEPKILQQLYDRITAIQRGDAEDRYNWLRELGEVHLPKEGQYIQQNGYH
ncbi:unnamed protein product [Vitrella brassicaformis CCMP3155]|uniref:Branched-chain-amino-acid transaminase n=1 Tax=Vitrella brassicaformis (strain CCMP3155) TaxID=1169540 RepID=A0A0G4G7Q6_VITBC|nr:unnamed protein product [Vitrella brassicaformis CCMP3155]|mmetsp:Transcript_10535/g.25560  ORF Transcript_10535/g.25560 Transcript_10535/m.25560 type:complete len:374 (-) Transcript_10535:549-1670(-)|eukprot:CEM24740.1 unnamed protein product [Vitrella brassicaformis CCMP3155]